MEAIHEAIHELTNIENNNVTRDFVESLTQKIGHIYKETGSGAGIITVFKNLNEKYFKRLKRNSPDQPWFNKDCGLNRKAFFKAKHRH